MILAIGLGELLFCLERGEKRGEYKQCAKGKKDALFSIRRTELLYHMYLYPHSGISNCSI
jgi:hypothetical protein